jgi:hypothetical protein
MIVIPTQLKKLEFRFLLLSKKHDKKSPEKNWTTDENFRYTYDNPKLLSHLATDRNYGVSCLDGDLIVIDCDTYNLPDLSDAVKHCLPPTFSVKTTSGGEHYYYKIKNLKKKITFKNKNKVEAGSIQAGGVYAVGPGCIAYKKTKGADGKHAVSSELGEYRIIDNHEIQEITLDSLQPLNEYFLIEYEEYKTSSKEYQKTSIDDIPINKIIDMSKLTKYNETTYKGANPWHGSTNRNNFQVELDKNIARCWRDSCSCNISPIRAIALNEHIIANCTDELKGEKFLAAKKIATEKYGFIDDNSSNESDDISQEELINLLTEGVEYFKDQFEQPHARIRFNDHYEIYALKTENFRRWVLRRIWDTFHILPNSDKLKTIISLLGGRAVFDGVIHKLHNRVAWHENKIYYDMCDDLWSVIEIDSSGWREIKESPVWFRRYSHQLAQTAPAQSGDITLVKKFTNLIDDSSYQLFLITLMSELIPDIPHPIIVLHGLQGSAKSTQFKICRKLVDPSRTEVLTMPTDRAQLIQIFSHNYVVPFDNVHMLNDEQSDAICRAVTGDGSSKRQLYTDDDDIIYNYRRIICLNGINAVAQKPDILDRSVLLECKRIDKTTRRDEKQLWNEFENSKTQIFSGMLTILSKAMKIYPGVSLTTLPRMADFAIWGEAISQASGYRRNSFSQIYTDNISRQHTEVIENSSLGFVLHKFMENRDEWSGPPNMLYVELTRLARESNVDTSNKFWPNGANYLTRRLRPLENNFRELGIIINLDCHDGTKRAINLTKSRLSKNVQNGTAACSHLRYIYGTSESIVGHVGRGNIGILGIYGSYGTGLKSYTRLDEKRCAAMPEILGPKSSTVNTGIPKIETRERLYDTRAIYGTLGGTVNNTHLDEKDEKQNDVQSSYYNNNTKASSMLLDDISSKKTLNPGNCEGCGMCDCFDRTLIAGHWYCSPECYSLNTITSEKEEKAHEK